VDIVRKSRFYHYKFALHSAPQQYSFFLEHVSGAEKTVELVSKKSSRAWAEQQYEVVNIRCTIKPLFYTA